MTEKQLRDAFDRWQHRLGLDLWQITISIEPCETDSILMECRRSSSYDAATIAVQPYVLTGKIPGTVTDRPVADLSDTYLEMKVVHELLHCVTRDLRYVEDLYDRQLHPDAWRAVEQAYKRAEESTVDRLANALTRTWSS